MSDRTGSEEETPPEDPGSAHAPSGEGSPAGSSADQGRLEPDSLTTDGVAREPDPPSLEDGPCTYTEYVSGSPVEDLPATGADATGLEADVWDALYAIEDPEMPISIVDLGLIYGVEIDDDGDGSETVARVTMTLTYTGCPARDMLTGDVEREVAAVEGIDRTDLDLVWNPPWSLELVTDRGKADLREFGLSV